MVTCPSRDLRRYTEVDCDSGTMGVCYWSSYLSLCLNEPPHGAEPLVKEQTPSAAGAGLMML